LRYLLDTNICIYVVNNRPEAVRRRFAAVAIGDVGMSVVTYGELIWGAEASSRARENLQRLRAFARLVMPLDLPSDAAGHYGEIRAALQKKGAAIGPNDLWIAAHARAAGLVLVSNNEREFRRVPRLKVENWAQG
jgi:tRNA(fMet)-specific endonuclease VapC